jgi:hypothetical protein
MATFPALRPRSRSYNYGSYSVTNEATSAGSVRFLHGDIPTDHQVQLGFVNLKQAEARLIRNHYRGQNGGQVPFALSPLAWAGHTNFDDLVPSTTLWRYADEPQEIQKNGGFIDVSVQLTAVI